MRQRNTSGTELIFPTIDPPTTIPDGWEIDYPELLPGFEPVSAAAETAAEVPPPPLPLSDLLVVPPPGADSTDA